MTTPAIEIRSLRKSFGDKTVLDGIDLTVPAGSVYALLGPNGAGKTTAVHICSTLLRPDDGTVQVAGYDVVSQADSVRGAIGLTGQFAAVDGLLTGRENLQLMADLRHLPRRVGRARVDELLEQFDLTDAANKQLASYSGGMRRRLDLAMTLVGGSSDNPSGTSIIFLDEPTTGLDPRSRATMWDIVRRLVDEGTTIFLTTQYLEEADQLADRIGVLNAGQIVAQGSATDLKRLVPGGTVRLSFADAAALESARRTLADLAPRGADVPPDVDNPDYELAIASDGSFGSVKAIVDRLDADARVAGLTIDTPTLDDVFFALTGPTATQEVSR